MKVIEFYDYIYYRLAKWYFNSENKDEKFSSGAFVIVSLSQFMILTDILGIYMLEAYSQDSRIKIIDEVYPIIVSSFILLLIINGFRYYNKYRGLKSKWKDENKNVKFFRTIIISLVIIIPIILIPAILLINDYR